MVDYKEFTSSFLSFLPAFLYVIVMSASLRSACFVHNSQLYCLQMFLLLGESDLQ